MLSNILRHSQRNFSAKVLVSGLKPEWTDHDIRARFNSVGPITQVDFLKSHNGSKNGEAVLTYSRNQDA